VFRGRTVRASRSWMTLRVQANALQCKDVFDRVVVFDEPEIVEADTTAKAEEPNTAEPESQTSAAAAVVTPDDAPATPKDEDLEFGVSSVAHRGKDKRPRAPKKPVAARTSSSSSTGPAKKPGGTKRKADDDDDDDGGAAETPAPPPRADRPKRSRSAVSYKEAAEEDESDDDSVAIVESGADDDQDESDDDDEAYDD